MDKSSAAIDNDLLAILVCPQNKTALTVANKALIDKLNQQAKAGTLRNQSGESVTSRLDGGLLRDDGMLLYPIVDGIPVLLADEAIPLKDTDNP